MQRLITAMRAAGVRPTIRDGRLVIDRPDVLDADLLREVIAHEAAIVSFVLAAQAGRAAVTHQEEAATFAPLTPSQSGLLFLDRVYEGSGLFNIVTQVEIRGSLDLGALLRALRFVLSCHPILTARVAESDGTVGWLDGDRTLAGIVSVIDTAGAMTALQREQLRRQLADREQRRVFTGASGWLRAVVVRFAADSWHLLMCRHHIASDGWSFALISQQLQDAYLSYRRRLVPQAGSPQQFWRYCRFMDERSRHPDGVRYWLTQLAAAPREIRLAGISPGRRRVSAAKSVRIVVPRTIVETLTPHKVTSFAFLLGIFALVLFEASFQEELCIGTDVTTRDRPEWERVVGMFVNRLVLRIAINDRAAVLDFLVAVQRVVSDALEWRYTSLDRLARRLGVSGESGLFNVIFGLHNNPHHRLRLGREIDCKVRDAQPFAMEVDLSLYFTSTDSGFRGMLAYRDGCISSAWAQRLARRYASLARAVAGGLNEPVRSLMRFDAARSESPADPCPQLQRRGATPAVLSGKP